MNKRERKFFFFHFLVEWMAHIIEILKLMWWVFTASAKKARETKAIELKIYGGSLTPAEQSTWIYERKGGISLFIRRVKCMNLYGFTYYRWRRGTNRNETEKTITSSGGYDVNTIFEPTILHSETTQFDIQCIDVTGMNSIYQEKCIAPVIKFEWNEKGFRCYQLNSAKEAQFLPHSTRKH